MELVELCGGGDVVKWSPHVLAFLFACVGCVDKDKQQGAAGSTSSRADTTSMGAEPTSETSTADISSTSPGPDVPEDDDDAFCMTAETETECGPGCDWTTRYEFPAGSCDAAEVVEECRFTWSVGDGCGSLLGVPGCAALGPALNGSDYPMFRVNPDGSTSIVVSSKCGTPPGFEECQPGSPYELPPECFCLCEN